jgi:hypothetical protein
MNPDPRIIEDMAEVGRRAMLKAARDDEACRRQIESAAAWLIERARVLREETSRG